MKLADVINAIGGEAPDLDQALAGLDTTSFVIDSREVKTGDVFFALSQPEYADNGFNGDFDDSTRYAASALDAGAAAVVLRRDRFDEYALELAPHTGRLIFVDDAIAALQRLARAVYRIWGGKVVAVTGSAGKTTAKELTAHVLAASGRKTLKNIKNYNNGLGHPLTVLKLAAEPDHDVAVLEMGMSTPLHEIERLCNITPPDVAVVLNVLPVHLEHLGTIERIAEAKAEIVEGMKPGGTAVLNADDPRVAAMRSLSKGDVLTFGIDNDADVRAVDISVAGFASTRFDVCVAGQRASVEYPLNGKHNILNALAAAAVGYSFGMTVSEIANALSTAEAPPQRGEVLKFADGFTVINDTYNSNPDALLSMTQTLIAGSPATARKVVFAGEMLELGDGSAAIHRRTGERIGAMGIDVLVGVRGNGRDLAAGAADAGIADVRFADDSAMAADIALELLRSGDVVLLKGSRGVRMEKIVERLLERFELEKKAAAK